MNWRIKKVLGPTAKVLILFFIMMLASDSFALTNSKSGADFSCFNSDYSAQENQDFHSSDEERPCSDAGHCHQHHCQMLSGQSSLFRFHAFSSPALPKQINSPDSPFYDTIPRPPCL